MKLSEIVSRLSPPSPSTPSAERVIREGWVTATLRPTEDFELPPGQHLIQFGHNALPVVITIPEKP